MTPLYIAQIEGTEKFYLVNLLNGTLTHLSSRPRKIMAIEIVLPKEKRLKLEKKYADQYYAKYYYIIKEITQVRVPSVNILRNLIKDILLEKSEKLESNDLNFKGVKK